MKDVVCIFELLLHHLHSLARDYRASILKSRDLVQLQESHLKTHSSNLILQMAKAFFDRFVLPSLFFEAQLIDYCSNDILNIGLKSLHYNMLSFSFEELIIPITVKDFLVIFA